MPSADRPATDYFKPGHQDLAPNPRNRLAGKVAPRASENGHTMAGSDEGLAEFHMSGTAGVVGANEELMKQQDVHGQWSVAGGRWPVGLSIRRE